MQFLKRLWRRFTHEKCPICGREEPRRYVDMFGACRACQRAAVNHRWDERLKGVLCEECCLHLSREVFGTCTRDPIGCWGVYALGRLAEIDADEAP